MIRYSTLDISAGSDARLWEQGCTKLGMSLENSLIKPSPTLAELTQFFSGWPNWIYFSGHFLPVSLFSDGVDVELPVTRSRCWPAKRVKNSQKSLLNFNCMRAQAY